MLGGIFYKRKKSQDLRAPSLHDLKKFRDTYAKYADFRQVETPSCFEKSIYKAISGQKELHSVEYRQEDITDPQMIALAEALLEMSMISSLDLRDNRITDDGARSLLEVLRQQIIAAKTPPTIDPRTKQPLYPQPEYTRYVTHVNLKGNEVSAQVLEEFSQYVDILRREDKRLEIRVALGRIDRNTAGSIDEDEFKGVLKLLTTSTPTKKEIRAFMQQHTLSTDSAQNVVNLENVLLAKCATSPSRKAASPPWESLVQDRHAILGLGRVATTVPPSLDPPSPSPTNARVTRPSLPSPSSVLGARNVSTFTHSNSASDVSPLAAAITQPAPVAPLEMLSVVAKPPPPPVVSAPAASQPTQHSAHIPDTKTVSPSSSDHINAPTKLSVIIPTLSLASLTQPPVSPSPRSARSHTGTSLDDEGHRTVSSAREGVANNSIAPAPSSPHHSDMSDSASVVSSVFGGPVSQRHVDNHERSHAAERKFHTPSISEASPSVLDSPRWQTDHLSLDDDDITSSGGLSGAREVDEESNVGDANDDVRSANSHGRALSLAPKSVVTSGSLSNEISDCKSVLSSQSRREISFQGSDAARELAASGSDYSTNGRDEKRSQSASVASTPRFDDLSSLVYRGMEDVVRPAASSPIIDRSDVPSDQPEEDEEIDDRVDSVLIDVVKDGKERAVVKLIHPAFRSGLPVKEFPGIPYRNLLAILLPENGLSDLALFAECRFPFAVILDVSRNKLTKLADDAFAPFPRLEVLNVANNQLKAISGVMKTFKLRALNASNNAIRTVKNVEHLVQLEVLQLAENFITTVHALRLLSLNKMLFHLNLDGNPVVVTDERQKRKNIVHVRNLLPMLQTLGSIPCLNTKKKTNSSPSSGKSLFDSELLPKFQSLWVSTACDVLQISQDEVSVYSLSHSQYDDDEWDTRDEDMEVDRSRKPLTREQQRQKDEMRSRAIGFRSRGKAIPSPPKVKTSVFCFGPSQPPPVKRKKKKPTPADPNVVKEQQRRASELSASKHPPVDQTLMRQEQKRKSRVDFQANLTVAERLLLARDMAQRRPTLGATSRSRSMLPGKRASVISSATIKEEANDQESNPAHGSSSPSPARPSPIKDAVIFRIDPANTPRSPKEALTFRVDPYPTDLDQQTSAPLFGGAKEAGFLHDLAVSDFLNHAEEEFSTALTALNVLLSMSEKEQGSRKKLADYRTSLDTLDILNEHENEGLFKKTEGHPDRELQAQCTEWFTKLGVVKKCMRQLLEKLEIHTPGSGVIRAYCRYIRSNELRGIITSILETQEPTLNELNEMEVSAENSETSHLPVKECESPRSITNDKKTNQDPAIGSVTSRLFAESSSSVPHKNEEPNGATRDEARGHDSTENHKRLSAGDSDLDFLESSDSVFNDEKTETTEADSLTSASEALDQGFLSDPVPYAATTDITMDIKMGDSSSMLNSNQNTEDQTDEISWTTDTTVDKAAETADEAVFGEEDEVVCTESESVQHVGDESHESAACEMEDRMPAQTENTTRQDEDYDWLASSTDLNAEINDVDSFEKDMAAVSEDEADGEAGVEASTEAAQDYKWSGTEAALEEGPENNEEPCNENYGIEEETEVGDYDADANHAEVSNEETEAVEEQHELEEGEDADDEEAEIFGEWEKGFDPNSNHYFWFNHSTGESSWTPPEGWPYELDEPFSDETAVEEVEGEGEQSGEAEHTIETEYEASAEQEYEEGATEEQEYEAGTIETQAYEYAAEEGEEEVVEGQADEHAGEEGNQYVTEGHEHEFAAEECQDYEGVQEGQENEDVQEGQEYEDVSAEQQECTDYVADEGQSLDHEGEDCRSEVSDFEFDDSDLPSF